MPVPGLDLKRDLLEAGNRLLKPPSSVDELLKLLDRLEQCLSNVEQQPPEGIQDVLCPSFKALSADELLKHPDTDVRVGVTACLTEISRITAPDVPYRDDMMKEVFRLTISAFEGLSDNSSKSFAKRVSILEIVARVRSCAVLLDLDCDDLVIEMLHNFYKCIRDFHSVDVFASMECIMTLVIEESEEISTNLLLTLLSVMKKEKKDAFPISKRLGEKVVQTCATKLKPYIVEAIKSLKINLLDYDFVVTKICQITVDHNPLTDTMLSVSMVSRSESAVAPVEEVAQAVVAEASPTLTMSIQRNGIVEVAKDDAHGLLNTSDKPDSYVGAHPSETIQDQVQDGHAALRSDMMMKPDSVSLSKLEPKSDKIAKKRGRKPKSAKETDSSKLPEPNGNKESSELAVSKVDACTKGRKALPNKSSVEPNVQKRNSESSGQLLSAKPAENDAVTLGSPSLSDSPEKISRIRIRKSKKAAQEATSSYKNTENSTSDGLNTTEHRLVSSEKTTPDGVVGDASKLVSYMEVKKEQYIEGDSEKTPLKQSGDSDETPRMKKRGRPRKDASMSAATDGVSSEGTSKKRSRRRFTQPEDGKEYGEELVGSRIKVWWPQDKVYYDGIIESFDSVKKRHKILYTDNEREVLNLHKQKWKLVKNGLGSEKDAVVGHTNAGDASDSQQIKKLKTNSVPVGILGDTDSPLKRRPGRPPKSLAALANDDNTIKGNKPTDEAKANESKIDSMDDAGNPVNSIDSVAKIGAVLDLNAELENSDYDVPEHGGTQRKKDITVSTGIMDTVAPKTAVGFDINETVTLGSEEKCDANETATPEGGNSNVNTAEEVNSGPSAGLPTEGVSQKDLASGTRVKPRKRKARTSFDFGSLAVPGSSDALVKRRPGRPSKLSLGTIDAKSKSLSKPLGDPKDDDSKSVAHADLGEGLNVPDRNVGLKVSEHGTADGIVTKLTPNSMSMETKDDVVLLKTSGELQGGVKLQFKTPDSEPKQRKKKSRKNTSLQGGSDSEQVNKDGSVKSPRRRASKPKIEVPKPDSKSKGSNNLRAEGEHKADDSDSSAKSKAEIIYEDVDLKNMEDSPKVADNLETPLTSKAGSNDVANKDVKLATETKGDDKLSEGKGKSRKKRSKKPRRGEVFFS
ncbi:unnamed protein product [Rhodiola kirilowii]